jgi:Legionella pneumophila major outer membrane protein precursor
MRNPLRMAPLAALVRMAPLAALAFTVLGTPGPAAAAEYTLEVTGALLQFAGDGNEIVSSVAAPTKSSAVPSDGITSPNRGSGGRIQVGVELKQHLYFSGSVNGAWLDNTDMHDFGSGTTQENQAKLGAFWADAMGFYVWQFGRPARPHTHLGLGAGLEYADLQNSFRENDITDSGGSGFTFLTRRKTTFRGAGPRVGAFLDHELGQSGVHFFGEVGAACLAGRRRIDQNLKSTTFTDSGGPGGGGTLRPSGGAPPVTTVVLDVSDENSQSAESCHYNGRIGVGYEFPLGEVLVRASAGWQYDRFTDVNLPEVNVFGPSARTGDNTFHGPFASIGLTVHL